MTEERFEISCPGCNQQYEVDDTRLGTELACHGCGETFVISDEMLQTIDADSPDEMHHEKVEDVSERITKKIKRFSLVRTWPLVVAVALCLIFQSLILFEVKKLNIVTNKMSRDIGEIDSDINRIKSTVYDIERVVGPSQRWRITTPLSVDVKDIKKRLEKIENRLP